MSCHSQVSVLTQVRELVPVKFQSWYKVPCSIQVHHLALCYYVLFLPLSNPRHLRRPGSHKAYGTLDPGPSVPYPQARCFPVDRPSGKPASGIGPGPGPSQPCLSGSIRGEPFPEIAASCPTRLQGGREGPRGPMGIYWDN